MPRNAHVIGKTMAVATAAALTAILALAPDSSAQQGKGKGGKVPEGDYNVSKRSPEDFPLPNPYHRN